MPATIRAAGESDVAAMVRLSARARAKQELLSPVFWRRAADADAQQTAFFRALLTAPDWIALVAEDGGELAGFALARIAPAPPVYDPGGPVCLVDDFCVAATHEWSEIGRALLDAAEQRARERGAVASVVVCPHLGGAKRELLAARGFEPTSEWHVRRL